MTIKTEYINPPIPIRESRQLAFFSEIKSPKTR